MALKLGKCRLCLKLGDFFSIFSVDSSLQLAEMAMACAQVKIFEGDGLTDKVCGECVEKLSSAYIFKQQCERSDQELRRNYVTPPGFSHTPPPNRQSSDSGYSNRTDASGPPKHASKPEEPASAPSSNRKRKRTSAEPAARSLLQESFSLNIDSPVADYSRPKTPDKRPRYEQDSDYEYPAADDSDDSNSAFKCEQCDKKFPSRQSVAVHRRVHTKEKALVIKSDAVLNIPSPEIYETPNSELSCLDCGKTFKLQIMLKRHMEHCSKSSGEAKPAQLATQNKTPETERPPQPEPVPIGCLFCDTYISDYYNYTAHFNSCPDYRELESYKCQNCPSQFNRKANYLRHLRTKHMQLPVIKSNSAEVNTENTESFECRICNKKMASQDLLVTHLAAHMSNIDEGLSASTAREQSIESTGDDVISLNSDTEANKANQQSCKFCGKHFTYLKSLQTHIQVKHSGGNEVIIKTEQEEMPEEFLESDDDNDNEGETDNTCDICEKEFSYRKTLLHHKATKHNSTSGHKISSVKFNKCEVRCLHCNVTMLGKDVKAHNQVHINANIKPKSVYTCYECGSSFKGTDSLRTHIKLVHRLNQEDSGKGKYHVTDIANFCEVVVTKPEPMDDVLGHNDLKSVPGQALDSMKPVVDLSGFTCPLCSKKMPTLLSLKRHVVWHGNVGNNIESKHHCNICNAQFKFNSHYKLHMKEHLYDTNLSAKFLTCEICNRKSKHLRAAQAHSRWHQQTRFSNKDYQCSICKRVFQERKGYLWHMAVHYKKGEGIDKSTVDTKTKPAINGNEHMCHYCHKILDSAVSLKSHIAWHTSKASLYGPRYECEVCHVQFTNKNRHKLHLRTHYEDENGPHKCPICGKGYNNVDYFQRHVKGHNFDRQSQVKKKQRLREMRQKKVQCPICCRYYPDLLHLVRHAKRMHPESKMIKQDPDAPPDKVFRCKLCAKVFLDEKRLQFHEEAHLRKPVHFYCKWCSYSSTSIKNHNVHVKSHLVKKYRDQPLECPRCEEKFVFGYALHHHLRDVHGIRENWATERPIEKIIGPLQQYQCSLCYKVLTNRSYYERHLDYHNTLRCNYCFEYFSGKVFLNGHLEFSCEKRKLIGDTEVHLRKVKCSECFKAFHLQVKLECHMYTQHGARDFKRSTSSKLELVCDFCFRVFDNEEALSGHKVYHRTVGFYGCRYCKRKFCSITNYNKHKNHHLSQMCIDDPVKCDHCDEKFDWFRDMIYHMRNVHGDDKEWITMPKESVEEECGICHKRFFNVQRHLQYHEQNRCRKCREYFYSRIEFDAHLCDIMSDDEPETTVAEDGTVVAYGECQFCFKQTSKAQSMLKHDLSHKKSGSISCRFCPEKFKSIDTFNIHAFSHRTRKYKRNPLACPVCNERFVQYGPFMRHLREGHSLKLKMYYRGTVVPEQCVVCRAFFPNLHNHYRAHLNYRCSQCLKYFTSSKVYLNHACDKEDADASKVFTCDENLPELIKSYVPKEKSGELVYYKLGEPELDIVEPLNKTKLEVKPAFLEIKPIISDITSLKPPNSQNGGADSDDDCVVIVIGDDVAETSQLDTICLDD